MEEAAQLLLHSHDGRHGQRDEDGLDQRECRAGLPIVLLVRGSSGTDGRSSHALRRYGRGSRRRITGPGTTACLPRLHGAHLHRAGVELAGVDQLRPIPGRTDFTRAGLGCL